MMSTPTNNVMLRSLNFSVPKNEVQEKSKNKEEKVVAPEVKPGEAYKTVCMIADEISEYEFSELILHAQEQESLVLSIEDEGNHMSVHKTCDYVLSHFYDEHAPHWFKSEYVECTLQNLNIVPVDVHVEEAGNNNQLDVSIFSSNVAQHICLLGIKQPGMHAQCVFCSFIPAQIMHYCDYFRYLQVPTYKENMVRIHGYLTLHLEICKLTQFELGNAAFWIKSEDVKTMRRIAQESTQLKITCPNWDALCAMLDGIANILSGQNLESVSAVAHRMIEPDPMSIKPDSLTNFKVVVKERTLSRVPCVGIVPSMGAEDLSKLMERVKRYAPEMRPKIIEDFDYGSATVPDLLKMIPNMVTFKKNCVFGNLFQSSPRDAVRSYKCTSNNWKPADASFESWTNYHNKHRSHHPEAWTSQMSSIATLECIVDIFSHIIMQQKGDVKQALRALIDAILDGDHLREKFKHFNIHGVLLFMANLVNYGLPSRIKDGWFLPRAWRNKVFPDKHRETLANIIMGNDLVNKKLLFDLPGMQESVDEVKLHIWMVETIMTTYVGLDVDPCRHDRDKLDLRYAAWQVLHFGKFKPKITHPKLETKSKFMKADPTAGDDLLDIFATLGVDPNISPLVPDGKIAESASAFPVYPLYHPEDPSSVVSQFPPCACSMSPPGSHVPCPRSRIAYRMENMTAEHVGKVCICNKIGIASRVVDAMIPAMILWSQTHGTNQKWHLRDMLRVANVFHVKHGHDCVACQMLRSYCELWDSIDAFALAVPFYNKKCTADSHYSCIAYLTNIPKSFTPFSQRYMSLGTRAVYVPSPSICALKSLGVPIMLMNSKPVILDESPLATGQTLSSMKHQQWADGETIDFVTGDNMINIEKVFNEQVLDYLYNAEHFKRRYEFRATVYESIKNAEQFMAETPNFQLFLHDPEYLSRAVRATSGLMSCIGCGVKRLPYETCSERGHVVRGMTFTFRPRITNFAHIHMAVDGSLMATLTSMQAKSVVYSVHKIRRRFGYTVTQSCLAGVMYGPVPHLGLQLDFTCDENLMKNPDQRRQSFLKFPIKMLDDELAISEGLYWTGNGLIMKCINCDFQHEFINNVYSITYQHRLHGKCYHQCKEEHLPASVHQDIEKLVEEINYMDRMVRVRSYTRPPHPSISTKALADVGFYELEPGITKCAFCGLVVDRWSDGDIPLKVHKAQKPDCYYLKEFNEFNLFAELGMSYDDTVYGDSDSDIGSEPVFEEADPTMVEDPYVSDIKTVDGRIVTLESKFKPDKCKELAKAGLFLNIDGKVECCCCTFVLEDTSCKEPKKVHKNASKDCPFWSEPVEKAPSRFQVVKDKVVSYVTPGPAKFIAKLENATDTAQELLDELHQQNVVGEMGKLNKACCEMLDLILTVLKDEGTSEFMGHLHKVFAVVSSQCGTEVNLVTLAKECLNFTVKNQSRVAELMQSLATVDLKGYSAMSVFIKDCITVLRSEDPLTTSEYPEIKQMFDRIDKIVKGTANLADTLGSDDFLKDVRRGANTFQRTLKNIEERSVIENFSGVTRELQEMTKQAKDGELVDYVVKMAKSGSEAMESLVGETGLINKIDKMTADVSSLSETLNKMMENVTAFFSKAKEEMCNIIKGITGVDVSKHCTSDILTSVVLVLLLITTDNMVFATVLFFALIRHWGVAGRIAKWFESFSGWRDRENITETTVTEDEAKTIFESVNVKAGTFPKFSGTSAEPTSWGISSGMVEKIMLIFSRANPILWGVGVSTFIMALIGITVPVVKYMGFGTRFVQTCRNLYFVKMGALSIPDLWSYCSVFITWLSDACSDFVGLEAVGLKQPIRDRIHEWSYTVKYYNSSIGKGQIISCPDHALRAASLAPEGINLLKEVTGAPDSPAKSQLINMINHELEDAFVLEGMKHVVDAVSRDRMAPVHISNYGDSGVGKSFGTGKLIEYISHNYYNVVTKLPVYVHPVNDAFMERYDGHKIMVIDDLLSHAEGADAALLIQLHSPFPCIINKANPEEKGSVVCDIDLILSTTNIPYPSATQLKSLQNPQAFMRRRDILAHWRLDTDTYKVGAKVSDIGFRRPRRWDFAKKKLLLDGVETKDKPHIIPGTGELEKVKHDGSVWTSSVNKIFGEDAQYTPWIQIDVMSPMTDEIQIQGLTVIEYLHYCVDYMVMKKKHYADKDETIDIGLARHINDLIANLDHLSRCDVHPERWMRCKGMTRWWLRCIEGNVVNNKEVQKCLTKMSETSTAGKLEVENYFKYAPPELLEVPTLLTNSFAFNAKGKKYTATRIERKFEGVEYVSVSGVMCFTHNQDGFSADFMSRLLCIEAGKIVPFPEYHDVAASFWLATDGNETPELKKELNLQSYSWSRLHLSLQMRLLAIFRVAIAFAQKYPIDKIQKEPTKFQNFMKYAGKTALWILVTIGVVLALRAMLNATLKALGIRTIDEAAKDLYVMACNACRSRFRASDSAFQGVEASGTSRVVYKPMEPTTHRRSQVLPTAVSLDPDSLLPPDEQMKMLQRHELQKKMSTCVRYVILEPTSEHPLGTQMWSFGGHYWFINWHAVETKLSAEHGKLHMYVYAAGAKERQEVYVPVNMIDRVEKNRDIALMFIVNITPARKAYSSLITDQELREMTIGYRQAPTSLIGVSTFASPYVKTHVVDIMSKSKIEYAPVHGKNTWSDDCTIRVSGNWEKGMSGGLVAAVDNKLQHKLMGVLVAVALDQKTLDIKEKHGWISIITQEQYHEWVDTYVYNHNTLPLITQEGPIFEPEVMEPIVSELAEPTRCEYVSPFVRDIICCGQLSKSSVVSLGGKSEIYPIPEGQDLFGPGDDIVSIISKNDRRCPPDHEPLLYSVNKCGMDTVEPYDVDQLNEAAYGLEMYLREHIPLSHDFRELPLELAIQGRKAPGYRNLNVKTSPGLPHVLTKKKPGKKEFCSYTESGEVVYTPQLESKFTMVMSSLKSGTVPKHSWYDIPKDELRAKEKLYKTRSISVGDFVFTLAYRSLCADFMAVLHILARGDFIPCVGINMSSADASRFWHMMRQYSKRAIDGDIRNFDGHVLAQLLYKIAQIMNSIYGDDDSSPNGIARIALMMNAAYGFCQWNHWLYIKPKGMPSGFAGTAEVNTLVHLLALYYGYRIWCIGRCLLLELMFNKFVANVFVRAYSDDVVIVIHFEFPMTVEDISDIYCMIGFPLTAADKTGEIHEQSLSEVTFLKRYFRNIPETSLTTGVLDKEVIYNMVRWVRKTSKGKMQIYDNYLMAAEAMSMWGRVDYDQFVKEVNRILSLYSLPLIDVSFNDMKMLMTDRYLHPGQDILFSM